MLVLLIFIQYFATNENGGHLFYTGGTSERLWIRNDGSIGIGTNNPQSRLHLHNTNNTVEVLVKLTDNTTGIGVNDGIVLEKIQFKIYL